MRYDVQVRIDATYTVDAETPEEAAQIVDDGDGGNPDYTGLNVEAVTAVGDWMGEDLRAPLHCKGCHKALPASGNDRCTKCFLDYLDAKRGLVGSPQTKKGTK